MLLISYDNRYFQDKYQGVPKDGFTPMFEHMLDHENIEVVLDTDCGDVLKFTGNEILFEGKPFAGDVIWVDWNAYQAILAKLREIAGGSVALDMLLANYVYEKEGQNTSGSCVRPVFRKIRSLPGVMCGIFIKDITY